MGGHLMKKILLLIVPLIGALCALFIVEKVVNSEAGNEITPEGPPVVTCYKPMSPDKYEPSIEELYNQLKALDDVLKHNIINEETYQIRKEDLLKRIEEAKKKEEEANKSDEEASNKDEE